MEAMINYRAARELRHAKRHFDVMCHEVQPCSSTILYFIRLHIELIVFSVFYLYHDVFIYDIPQACYTRNSCFSMFITF